MFNRPLRELVTRKTITLQNVKMKRNDLYRTKSKVDDEMLYFKEG